MIKTHQTSFLDSEGCLIHINLCKYQYIIQHIVLTGSSIAELIHKLL